MNLKKELKWINFCKNTVRKRNPYQNIQLKNLILILYQMQNYSENQLERNKNENNWMLTFVPIVKNFIQTSVKILRSKNGKVCVLDIELMSNLCKKRF